MLTTHTIQLFFIANSPKTFFLPVLSLLCIFLILHLFHIQELVSNIKLCIYQLSFSQTYKMAIKNSQK